MAKNKMPAELEQAIVGLPAKEKDKLLLRLIKKDELLTDQLQYRLLENSEADLTYRRRELQEQIALLFDERRHPYFKELLKATREAVAIINRHFKVTRDTKGELELLIFLFQKALAAQATVKNNWRDQIFRQKFQHYALTKMEKMNKLLSSLHEDFHVDYANDIEGLKGLLS